MVAAEKNWERLPVKAVMMREQKRNRRILYIPGLISLVLLPALGIWFVFQNDLFKQVRVMEVFMWSPDYHKDEPRIFPENPIAHISHFNHISLDGDDSTDKIKLDYGHLVVKELLTSTDTTKAIHFHFGKRTKYWTLVKVLDILLIEDADGYIISQEDIWVINNPRRLRANFKPMLICGNSNLVIYEKRSTEDSDEFFTEEVEQFIKDNSKTYFLSGLLFVLLGFLSMRHIHEIRTQNEKHLNIPI